MRDAAASAARTQGRAAARPGPPDGRECTTRPMRGRVRPAIPDKQEATATRGRSAHSTSPQVQWGLRNAPIIATPSISARMIAALARRPPGPHASFCDRNRASPGQVRLQNESRRPRDAAKRRRRAPRSAGFAGRPERRDHQQARGGGTIRRASSAIAMNRQPPTTRSDATVPAPGTKTSTARFSLPVSVLANTLRSSSLSSPARSTRRSWPRVSKQPRQSFATIANVLKKTYEKLCLLPACSPSPCAERKPHRLGGVDPHGPTIVISAYTTRKDKYAPGAPRHHFQRDIGPKNSRTFPFAGHSVRDLFPTETAPAGHIGRRLPPASRPSRPSAYPPGPPLAASCDSEAGSRQGFVRRFGRRNSMQSNLAGRRTALVCAQSASSCGVDLFLPAWPKPTTARGRPNTRPSPPQHDRCPAGAYGRRAAPFVTFIKRSKT